MKSFNFEVFGKVQGVFFRKYTQKKAKELQLHGWVRNTNVDTVVGYAEGQEDALRSFQTWLSKEGSPQSVIQKCMVSDYQEVDKFKFSEFSIHR